MPNIDSYIILQFNSAFRHWNGSYPANTRHSPNVDTMLDNRLRCLPDTVSTLLYLGECLVFAGYTTLWSGSTDHDHVMRWYRRFLYSPWENRHSIILAVTWKFHPLPRPITFSGYKFSGSHLVIYVEIFNYSCRINTNWSLRKVTWCIKRCFKI